MDEEKRLVQALPLSVEARQKDLTPGPLALAEGDSDTLCLALQLELALAPKAALTGPTFLTVVFMGPQISKLKRFARRSYTSAKGTPQRHFFAIGFCVCSQHSEIIRDLQSRINFHGDRPDSQMPDKRLDAVAFRLS